jgi:hypothetical protein
MTRWLKATSSITNKTDPSAASETRFTLALSIGDGAFVGWSWIEEAAAQARRFFAF